MWEEMSYNKYENEDVKALRLDEITFVEEETELEEDMYYFGNMEF